ncbi:MAG: cardiolipin synthase [Thermodesulfobacteriota bacterium]
MTCASHILLRNGFKQWLCPVCSVITCLCVFALQGCAKLPDIEKITAGKAVEKPPYILESRKPFCPEKSQAIIDNFQQQVGPTDILSQHIQLMETLSRSPLIAGNKVTLLRDGPETISAMTEAIRNAKDHIHLEVFIFRDDEVGRPLADLLIEKQAGGVTVRVIYDGFGTLKTPSEFFERMHKAGIALYEFNPFSLLNIGGRWKLHNRSHRKILIIDGKIAFTGGINFYHVYAKNPHSASAGTDNGQQVFWRDTQIKIQGPAAAQFQKLFLETWCRRQKNIPLNSNLFPCIDIEGDALIRLIAGSPEQRIPNVYAAYISAILNARKSIYISQAYLIPDENMLDAFSSAVQKGVDVQIIVPGKTDFWMPFYAGRAYYSRLLQSGVRLHEMKSAVLHSKTAVIDSVWSMVGSSNLDSLSFLHNTEANAVILDTDFAKKMEAMFMEDLAISEEIFPAQWDQRPWKNRIKETLARFFKYWL